MMKGCDMGCSHFMCGSIGHLKTCVNYPESMSEMIDTKNARIKKLEEALQNIVNTAEECDGWESFPRTPIDDAYEVLGESDD